MSRPRHPDSYYDEIKRKFAEERDLRLAYRPEGTQQFTSDFDGERAKYGVDPYSGPVEPRDPIRDTVEVLFIGGGFSALLTSARLREKGVASIRIVERGAMWAARGTGTDIPARRATWCRTTICRCSMKRATCRSITTRARRRSSRTAS